MKNLKSLLLLLSLAFSAQLFAHGDHHHGPSAKNSPKGGRMLETETLHVELVAKTSDVKIYVYDENMKPLTQLKDLKASFTTELPRKSKVPLKVETKEDHFSASFDKGAAHRYVLEMNVSHGGHSDTLKWTIE